MPARLRVTTVLLAVGSLLWACTPSESTAVQAEVNLEGDDFTSGETWGAAEALFRSEPRWLGADVSASIDLGDGRALWMFGDTFIATSPEHTRSESTMVRNTVAVQTGLDPRTATMAFAWREREAAPSSFFESHGERWYWPQHGARLEGDRLIVFLDEIKGTPGEGLGFQESGYGIVRFDGTTGPAATWPKVDLAVPPSRIHAVVGTAVVRREGYLIAFAHAIEGSRTGYLTRFREEDLAAGIVAPEWWTGDKGWLPETAFEGLPAALMDDLGTECSVHFDAGRNQWIHMGSRGFGTTTIAIRTAPALEGPWSEPVDVFTPAESLANNGTLVYAAKAHPELAGAPGGLVVTYATNSANPSDLVGIAGAALYWPKVVRLRLP